MKIFKTRAVKTPNRGTEKSAGIDFFIPDDFAKTIIKPNESILIPSGIKVNLPANTCLTFQNKSGVCTKKLLVIGAKIVDEDYQGEIHIHLINVGNISQTIEPGDKIAQGIVCPVIYESIEEVATLEECFTETTQRGEGGFGSTGVK